MWRNKKENQSKLPSLNGSRWRLIVAFIFLLAGALIYRLFYLQIKQGDFYAMTASNQQQTTSKLAPQRGSIYFTSNNNGQKDLYPVATNKEFAILYAVPKDIKSPLEMADKFYQFFDKPKLENQLKATTASSSPQAAALSLVIATSTKDKIISGYLKHFNRPKALYDSLNNIKIDDSQLLNLYAFLASSTSSPITPDQLELDNGQIVFKELSSQVGRVLTIPGLGYNLEQRRYYPEGTIGAHLLGFVNYNNNDIGEGKYGLEEFFNSELTGQFGSLKADKGGRSGVIIADDRQYTPPINGDDLVLTIDRNVEAVACSDLADAVKKDKATGGSIIAVNPQTGAIIAMCSLPTFDPNNYQNVKEISIFNNPAILYQYEPGSVFKAMTMSAALDRGRVTPNTTYTDHGYDMIPGWPKPIRNSDYQTRGGHGLTNMTTVLEYSLNTGAIFAMQQVGGPVFTNYVQNFGFGQKTGIELGAESSGDISNLLQTKVPEIDLATASFGQGIAATPLQMVMAYQAIANKGILMRPYVVQSIIHNGQREVTTPKEVRQVISAKTAATISGMLVNVVEFGRPNSTFIPGYYIGGKTGTAQVADKGGYSTSKYFHTFVGIAPIDHPAFVMLVKLDNPDTPWAEESALPLWVNVAKYMLNYYKIPKTRSN